MDQPTTDRTQERQRWMAVLSKAPLAELESACTALSLPPHEWLRRPETGLVMVRGRIGGTGAKFNVGEMSVTRCVLRLADGAVGVAYVRGRSARHAELAALVDALMQSPTQKEDARSLVIGALARAQAERADLALRRAAATRVNFYTVARGDAA